MAYEIIAIADNGNEVARLETKINHAAAHFLMDSLGIDYEGDEEEGSGDCYKFTEGEISAAQAGLVLLDGIPADGSDGIPEVVEAEVFLATVDHWFKDPENNQNDIEIAFF